MTEPARAPRIADALAALRPVDHALEGDALTRDLLRYTEDMRKVLEEALLGVADGMNFAGQQRAADGRIYRYHEETGLWLSDSRVIFSAARSALANSTTNTLIEHDITTTGYILPQTAVAVRWAWDWIGNSVAGDEARLLAGGATLHAATLGAVSSHLEELLDLGLVFNPSEQLRFVYSATGTAPQNAVAWVELAWTKTFDA